MRTIRAADLFCGAGGASVALRRACRSLGLPLELLAINHWPIVIETHRRNHPDVRHLCAAVESVDPRQAVPGGHLDLLMAGPECTHHSSARGGRPINDQSRASAWHILRWLELLEVDNVLIENVPEFQTWGPIGANRRPLKSRRGETFRAFTRAIESLNYRVEWRELVAADYGDPTTRRRLFIIARRGRRAIEWPAPTHSRTGAATLFGRTAKWRPARDVIDWSIRSRSIFGRKKPLSPKTMARIIAGLERFGGKDVQPFILLLNRPNNAPVPVDAPLTTVTAGSSDFALCEPFILQQQSGGVPRSVSEPLPTIATGGAQALVEAILYHGDTDDSGGLVHDAAHLHAGDRAGGLRRGVRRPAGRRGGGGVAAEGSGLRGGGRPAPRPALRPGGGVRTWQRWPMPARKAPSC